MNLNVTDKPCYGIRVFIRNTGSRASASKLRCYGVTDTPIVCVRAHMRVRRRAHAPVRTHARKTIRNMHNTVTRQYPRGFPCYGYIPYIRNTVTFEGKKKIDGLEVVA